MYRFLVVIERADGNYSAYAPDLPGCVATVVKRDGCPFLELTGDPGFEITPAAETAHKRGQVG